MCVSLVVGQRGTKKEIAELVYEQAADTFHLDARQHALSLPQHVHSNS